MFHWFLQSAVTGSDGTLTLPIWVVGVIGSTVIAGYGYLVRIILDRDKTIEKYLERLFNQAIGPAGKNDEVD